jgi:hypothetical protein
VLPHRKPTERDRDDPVPSLDVVSSRPLLIGATLLTRRRCAPLGDDASTIAATSLVGRVGDDRDRPPPAATTRGYARGASCVELGDGNGRASAANSWAIARPAWLAPVMMATAGEAPVAGASGPSRTPHALRGAGVPSTAATVSRWSTS